MIIVSDISTSAPCACISYRNLGHITGPRGEPVHQFEMFATLQYVVTHKPQNSWSVARQQALP